MSNSQETKLVQCFCDAWKYVMLFQIQFFGLGERRLKQKDIISYCLMSRNNNGKASTDGDKSAGAISLVLLAPEIRDHIKVELLRNLFSIEIWSLIYLLYSCIFPLQQYRSKLQQEILKRYVEIRKGLKLTSWQQKWCEKMIHSVNHQSTRNENKENYQLCDIYCLDVSVNSHN